MPRRTLFSLRDQALAISALVALAACSPPPTPLPDVPAMDATISMDSGPSCDGSQQSCSGLCVNLQTDRRNCGTCGVACNGANVCVAGRCQPTCPMGQIACNGLCVSVSNDPLNCGACGNACSAGQVCSRGACDLVCAATLTRCGGASGDAGASDGSASDASAARELCVDTRTDDRNCGACGRSCAAGESCVGGSCQVRCGADHVRRALREPAK